MTSFLELEEVKPGFHSDTRAGLRGAVIRRTTQCPLASLPSGADLDLGTLLAPLFWVTARQLVS